MLFGKRYQKTIANLNDPSEKVHFRKKLIRERKSGNSINLDELQKVTCKVIICCESGIIKSSCH